MADVTLNITTREKSFSKIAGFSSLTSINLILDILYSCLFNLNYKVNVAKQVETNRVIDNEIITEKAKKD